MNEKKILSSKLKLAFFIKLLKVSCLVFIFWSKKIALPVKFCKILTGRQQRNLLQIKND